MSFCKFNQSFIDKSDTIISNSFIEDHLPNAHENCIKVYIYGLLLCSHKDKNISISQFAENLNLSIEKIETAFIYWQDQGLVQILDSETFEVIYLPIKNYTGKIKKFKSSKYKDFNLKIQGLLSGKTITPTEYSAYYDLIEVYGMTKNALLKTVSYISEIKGNSINYQYIITVAKNWINEGIFTEEDVEKKLLEHELNLGKITEVLKALNIRRKSKIEERQIYLSWINKLKYDHEDIIKVAKKINKNKNIYTLDKLINNYYKLKLFTLSEINSYEDEKSNLYDTAFKALKNLGLYYDDVSVVVENYITQWSKMGYDKAVIETIANYCFKKGFRTLEEMNSFINKLYKLGLISLKSIEQHFNALLSVDNKIRKVLEVLGLHRNVNSWDRSSYRTWTYSWEFSEEMIIYAAELSKTANNPIKYLNKILSNWKDSKIKEIAEAKKTNLKNINDKKQKDNFIQRSYTDEELDALFDDIEEVDV